MDVRLIPYSLDLELVRSSSISLHCLSCSSFVRKVHWSSCAYKLIIIVITSLPYCALIRILWNRPHVLHGYVMRRSLLLVSRYSEIQIFKPHLSSPFPLIDCMGSTYDLFYVFILGKALTTEAICS